MNAARAWGQRHPYAVIGVRLTAAIWNLILGTILITHGYQWGAALYAVAALIVWAAFNLVPGKPGFRHHGQS